MRFTSLVFGSCVAVAFTTGAFAVAPQSPRIGNVEVLADQGWTGNPATIWYDNFDSSDPLIDRYLEAPLVVPVSYEALGGTGQSVRGHWTVGQEDAGNLKKSIGRNPADYRGLGARSSEDFNEVYWRHYVKMQEGWIGQPLKLTLATSFAASNWSQAMIATLWEGTSEGNPNTLGIDPVRGVNSASQVVTTGFNDFANFTWLGHKNASSLIYETAESGRWVSVEARAKLNTPGQADGVFQVWIDGQMEISSTNLNWVYSWDDYGINSVWLINWWNAGVGGSVADQERYFDDFVISTAPIGLAISPLNPLVTKTSFNDSDAGDAQAAWQLQIASDIGGSDVVWDSDVIAGAGLSIGVNTASGAFQGSLAGADRLLAEHLYALRVRQQDTGGQWSSWSDWNTSLQTGAALPVTGDFNSDGKVDAADYTVWRDNLGAADESSINFNGDGLNGVDAGDYSLWKTNFGTIAGAGALGTTSAVPEPTGVLLACIGLLTVGLTARQRHNPLT